jgi:hypothetical protein
MQSIFPIPFVIVFWVCLPLALLQVHLITILVGRVWITQNCNEKLVSCYTDVCNKFLSWHVVKNLPKWYFSATSFWQFCKRGWKSDTTRFQSILLYWAKNIGAEWGWPSMLRKLWLVPICNTSTCHYQSSSLSTPMQGHILCHFRKSDLLRWFCHGQWNKARQALSKQVWSTGWRIIALDILAFSMRAG